MHQHAMKQETLCASPVELFTVNDSGAASSKGACVCAIVALPSRPPKYSLVCYNVQQVTLCVARMRYVDAVNTSLQLLVHPSSGNVSFLDDGGQRWTMSFEDTAQQMRFLACCGVSFYSLLGAPATSVFSHDVSFPSSSLRLEVEDQAHVCFTAFELNEKDDLYSVGAQREWRKDDASDGLGQPSLSPYIFQPKASMAQRTQDCYGFEGNLVGMREDDWRVLVVPAGFTTRVSESLTGVATQGFVFVVQLVRVEHVRVEEDLRGHSANELHAPPLVYAAAADAENQGSSSALSEPLTQQQRQQRALVVVEAPTTANAAMSAPPTAATSLSTATAPEFMSSSGIPADHFSVLRRLELGVNTAVASARDVRDVTAIFSQDWLRFRERPKPSLLSHRAILEQVQRVVEEESAAQAKLDQCNSAIQVLEARNKELRQRVDKAVKDSQRSLEEKNDAAVKAMDARLERERQLLKLKEALLAKRQEQEDLQRHVTALQRTVDISNEELRQVMGRHDVHQVESTSMVERLSAMQASLSDERHRNAALTSKMATTEEAIRKAQAHHRLAEGQLTNARGLAERERLRYMQVMEEEREHRMRDADLLRQEIEHELDARERQNGLERHRLAEEQFLKGLQDGKAKGREAAEMDVLSHQDELRLNLQRAKTAVETRKEAVRRSIEAAMALRRTLGNKVGDLEQQLSSATRKKAQLQLQLAEWQTACRTAEDKVSQHWRALASYATHPCTRERLLKLMDAVREAEEASYRSGSGTSAEETEGGVGAVRVDLQFQVDLWRESRTRSIAQRHRWLCDDLIDLYVKGASYYYDEWLQPLVGEHDRTLEAVAQLYQQRHGSRALFDVCVGEAQQRWSLQQQWWVAVRQIEDWLLAQRTAQENVKSEEMEARQSMWRAYLAGGEAVVQLCAAQIRAQVMLLQREMQERDELIASEEASRQQLPSQAREQWITSCLAALRLLEEEEEAARAGLEAETYTWHSGLGFQLTYALQTTKQLSVQREERESLLAHETEHRQQVVSSAVSEFDRFLAAAAATSLNPAHDSRAEATPTELLQPVREEELHEAARTLSTPQGLEAAALSIGAVPAAQEFTSSPMDSTSGMHENYQAATFGGGHTSPVFTSGAPSLDMATTADAPAFGFADPPRVARDVLAFHGLGEGAVGDDKETSSVDPFMFSTEPPPIPPSDEVVAPPGEERGSSVAGISPLANTARESPPLDRPSTSLPTSSTLGARHSTNSNADSLPSLPQEAGDAAHPVAPMRRTSSSSTDAPDDITDTVATQEGGEVERSSRPHRSSTDSFDGNSSGSGTGKGEHGKDTGGSTSQQHPPHTETRLASRLTHHASATSKQRKPRLFDSSSSDDDA